MFTYFAVGAGRWLVALVVIVGVTFGAMQGLNGQSVVNIVADGNLASMRQSPLKSLAEATSKDTPVDFVDLTVRLIEAGDYEQAAKAFTVGMAYAQYDTMRVKDQTASQGIGVLVMSKFGDLSEAQTQAMQEQGDKLLKNGGSGVIELLTRFGKPSYHPRYLIQHGMGAFLNQGGDGIGIVDGFDGEKVWKSLLGEIKDLAN
jgi:hypothetical protein